MKILGLEISRSHQGHTISDAVEIKPLAIPKGSAQSIEDQAQFETLKSKPTKLSTVKVQAVKSPVLKYGQMFSRGRGHFIAPEYDLSEIGKITDCDGFVRQAFKKKLGLMFKEGVGYAGANAQTLQYIKIRMAQMARASNIPSIELMKRLAESLIRTSNAFLIKVRKTQASGGKIRTTADGKTLQPVAAYFPAAPETMQVDLNQETGKIVKWRQILPDGNYKEFNPQDVVHFSIDKREGFLFGVPVLIPVIDDVRALRQLEENIELLLWQHLFPLFHYKVGTETAPAGLDEAGENEVDVLKREIRLMPSEGCLVTPERHEIRAIGSEGRAIRSEGYLEHFKKRVFAGLGVSSVDMGEADTSNRACYSEDTETLTENGWKKYWEINPITDKIATVNPLTGLLEFQYCDGKIYLYDYQGEMVRFSSRTVDSFVTPDHDMWFCSTPSWSLDRWTKIHAEDISYSRFAFKMAANGGVGEEKDYFDLPHIPYKYHSNFPNAGPFNNINMDDWIEFLGYFISEGTYGRVPNSWAISLSQNERVYPEQTEKIRQCLQRLPFKFSEYLDADDTVRFWIHCKSLYLYLFHECGNYCYDKKIPEEYFYLCDRQLHIFFDALMLGDGGWDKRDGRTSFGYSSQSEILIDQMQTLCVRLGYRSVLGTGTRCQRLSITPKDHAQLEQRSIARIQYSGKVYCFNVPNHLFVTRRNGRIGIHGNTANVMSRALVDAVKDIQDSFEAQWDHEVVSELLLESTFGDDVLDETNMVHLQFAEIDILNKIDQEQHAAEMFKSQGLTWDEFRSELAREPILVPENGEDQDPSKYPEWFNTYWKLFEEPLNLIRAVDEPFSAAAKAATEMRTLALTQRQTQTSQQEKEREAAKATEEDRKTKVAVAQARPTARKDHFLASSFRDLEEDTANRLRGSLNGRGVVDQEYLLSLARVWATDVIDKLRTTASTELIKGFDDYTGWQASEAELAINLGRNAIRDRIERHINKLIESTIRLLTRRVDSIPGNVKLAEVQQDYIKELHIVFDSVRYRIDFIWDVELRKAYNFGRILGMRFLNEYAVQSVSGSGACERCQALADRIFEVASLDIDDVVPYHPGCKCQIKRIQRPEFFADQLDSDEEIDDATKLERCVLKVKQSLRKKNPGMGEKEIKSRAFAICNSQLKKG